MTKSEKLEFQIERKKRLLAEAKGRKAWKRLRQAWQTIREQNRMLETCYWYIGDREQKLSDARDEVSVSFQQQHQMQETIVRYFAVKGDSDTREIARNILAEQSKLAA